MGEEGSSRSKEEMGWIYEGTKSLVNREDYLLGKKIDRNFELYSDVVVKDREEEEKGDFFRQSLLRPTPNAKVSALDTRIVRNEDPLVALKFQEEQRKRQLLENPLLRLKAQRVLRKAFDKELKKASKKKKHKKDRDTSSSSSSSSAEEEGRQRDRRKRGRSERSRSRNRGEAKKRRQHEEDEHFSRRRHFAGDNRHGRRSRSTDGKRDRHFSHSGQREAKAEEVRRHESQSKQKQKLSAEEMERRRKEMMANASWRDEVRERNVSEAAEKLQQEQDEIATGRGASFMRPLMNAASEGATIEKRLQSNRMKIQRSYGDDQIDKSFMRK